MTLKNVEFKSMGCYLWEDADAKILECSFDGGLHGLYIWGRCEVAVSKAVIKNMELSGINIRDGATVKLEVLLHVSALSFCDLCFKVEVSFHMVLVGRTA